jgi:DNA-binding protein H-NS
MGESRDQFLVEEPP